MSEISPRARKLVEAYRNAVGAVHMGSGDDLPYTNARNALFDYIANLEASKSDERGPSEAVAWIETISYKGRLIGKGLVFHKPAPRPDVILEPLYAKPPAEAADVAYWKADSAAAWDKCEERRIAQETAEDSVTKLTEALKAARALGMKIYHNANAHEAPKDWATVRTLIAAALTPKESPPSVEEGGGNND